LAALDVAASRFLLAAEEAEEKIFGAAAAASSTTASASSSAAAAESEAETGEEVQAAARGRGVPRSVEYGQSEAFRRQRLVFTAAHRHALLGFTLYLATACSPLEPPPQAELLERLNRGVKDAEDTLLSDNGISPPPSSSSSSSPRALGAEVPTEDLHTLLCTVAPEAVPAVLALDLLARVLPRASREHPRIAALCTAALEVVRATRARNQKGGAVPWAQAMLSAHAAVADFLFWRASLAADAFDATEPKAETHAAE
jgi:hypothetical protein